MSRPRRRFEIFLPLRSEEGLEISKELFHGLRRELEYEFGGVTVDTHIMHGMDRTTGECCEELVHMILDVRESPENLAIFYKLKEELKTRFDGRVRITTFLIGIL